MFNYTALSEYSKLNLILKLLCFKQHYGELSFFSSKDVDLMLEFLCTKPLLFYCVYICTNR